MQDCCKAAPRRARYVVIAVVMGLAVLTGILVGGGAEPPPTGAPSSSRR